MSQEEAGKKTPFVIEWCSGFKINIDQVDQELMEKSGYPAFEQHLKLHEEFATHVADFLGSGDTWSEDCVQELRPS